MMRAVGVCSFLRSGRGLLLLVCLGGAANPSWAWAGGESPTDRALQLANAGKIDPAIALLRDHLKDEPKDEDARIALGRILDFDGRPDEAVSLWESALTGDASDYSYLMSVGEIRLRQGESGPNMTFRAGTVMARPSRDKDAEVRYKKDRLADAASAYEKARKLRPEAPEAAKALASVYSRQGKPEAALGVWKSLVALEPENPGFRLSLALATRDAGHEDEAADFLRRTLELDPRLAEAHEALAEHQEKKGLAAEAEKSRSRANFYKRLPSFATLTDTEENVRTLDALDQEGTVRKLAEDPSDRASEILAILCWSHPHNALEAEAFKALEARGAKTTPLLQKILDGAQSTCTIKSTAHILARRKTDGLLDYLEKMLPGDVRGFGMDMDIAGSLDDLGDPRAVEALARMVDPDTPGEGVNPLIDRNSARFRAALALGAFDTPESRKTLEAGAGTPPSPRTAWRPSIGSPGPRRTSRRSTNRWDRMICTRPTSPAITSSERRGPNRRRSWRNAGRSSGTLGSPGTRRHPAGNRERRLPREGKSGSGLRPRPVEYAGLHRRHSKKAIVEHALHRLDVA